MSTSCFVCLEDYNGKNKRLQCQYCPAEGCRGCHQRYLLQSYEDPHCMTCKRGWSTEFMAANFPMSFRNTTLRLHRRKVLFEREKALLPALQIYVEYRRASEKYKVEMEALQDEIGYEHATSPENEAKIAFLYRKTLNEQFRLDRLIKLQRQHILVYKARIANEFKDKPAELEEMTKLLTESRTMRDRLKAKREVVNASMLTIQPDYIAKRDTLRQLQANYWHAQALYHDRDGAQRPLGARREFIMKCPAEECRGFLSTAYKCGTCEVFTCRDCHIPIGPDRDAEHTCNPDTVESAKAIRAETQPCPKCGTRIFKVDGCDQMWCVMEGCGTAFSWNTGHIVTGVIHNPHYYEWLRRNGGAAAPAREVGDIPCGGMPTTRQFVHAIHSIEMPNELKTILLESFRNMQELITARLPGFPARMPQLINKDVDVSYLMNMLSEDEWKRQIELTEAKFNRKKEIGQILQTLVTAGSDMMNRLFEKMRGVVSDYEDIDEFVGWLVETGIPELNQLRVFGNESLLVLAKRDKMAVPQFEELWVWKGARALYKPPPKPKTEIVSENIAAT